MRKIFVIALSLFSSLALAATMSESEFTRHYVDRATAAMKDVQFRIVEPLQVVSKDVDGYEVTVFLDNAYAQYTSSPEKLDSIIDSHVRSLSSQREAHGSKEAKSILAVIKPADYLDNVKQQLAQAGLKKDEEFPLVYERFNEDLYVFYVFDRADGMRMITRKDLGDVKVDAASLRSIATRNLSAYFDANGMSVRRLEKTGKAKVYSVTLDENYEASILLLDRYWNHKTFDVQGQIVAFVPARNIVLVTGSDDREGIKIAEKLASGAYSEVAYSISPRGYVSEAGRWKAYVP